MTTPNEQQREPDELDLDTETIADLDVEETEGKEVRGGYTGACAKQTNNCVAGN
jgi:hypothetical protein